MLPRGDPNDKTLCKKEPFYVLAKQRSEKLFYFDNRQPYIRGCLFRIFIKQPNVAKEQKPNRTKDRFGFFASIYSFCTVKAAGFVANAFVYIPWASYFLKV